MKVIQKKPKSSKRKNEKLRLESIHLHLILHIYIVQCLEEKEIISKAFLQLQIQKRDHTPSNPDRQTPREERVEKGNS